MTFLKKKNWHNKNHTNFVKLINDHYFTFAISESIKMASSFIDDRGTNSFSAATRRGLFLPYFLDRYRRKFLFLVYTPALARKKSAYYSYWQCNFSYLCKNHREELNNIFKHTHKVFSSNETKVVCFWITEKITQKVPISQNEAFSPCLFLTIKDESCSLVKCPNTLSDICDFFLTLSNTPSSPQHEASSTADSQFSRELIWFPRQALVTLFFLEEVHESRDSLFSTLGESELSQYLFSSSIIWWTKQPGKSARIFSSITVLHTVNTVYRVTFTHNFALLHLQTVLPYLDFTHTQLCLKRNTVLWFH